MSHLRSPVVHHLGIEPMELLDFARTARGRKYADFAPPYDRPALALFQAHCEHVVESQGLDKLRVKGYAKDLDHHQDGFLVETSEGPLKARRVLLALGAGDHCHWPYWAKSLRDEGAPVWHLFQEDFDTESLETTGILGIVGLGISAAQLANRTSAYKNAEVKVFSRHEVRVHQFDSEPCWLGPKCQSSFWAEKDYTRRREMITEARHRGSMSADVAREYRERLNGRRLQHFQDAIAGALYRPESGQIELYTSSGRAHVVDRLVLATGFECPSPGKTWLAKAMQRLDLRCSSCGYPILDATLQWTSGLHVSGPLAELELGPAARNIAGARMTARRLGRLSP